MIMARERSLEEQAQRRAAQQLARGQRSSGRGPAQGSHFAAKLRGMVQIATGHPGSKRGASHRPDASADNRRAQAAVWSQVTGRPLPPQARIRTDKVSPAVPMLRKVRVQHYGAVIKSSGEVPGLTPAQRRRDRHKTGRQLRPDGSAR